MFLLSLLAPFLFSSPLPCAPTTVAPQDKRLFETPWVGYDASNYNSARYTYASAVADLDRDGRPDVVTTSWPSIPRLTVLSNLGKGRLAPPVVYTLPTGSLDVIAADFTGDGFPDVVASNTNPNFLGTSVSFLRNHGDGTLAPAVSFPSGNGPVGLVAADLDGDQDLDLVVADYGSGGSGSTVAVLLNDGDGAFAAPLTYPAGAGPFRVCALDLNGDAFPDLAVANGLTNQGGTAAIQLLLNDGAGHFASRRTLSGFYTGLSFFPTVQSGDLDGDGDPDLVYSDALTDGVFVFANQGQGRFSAGVLVPTAPFSGGFNSVVLADVTGDGWLDLIGAHQSNQGWSVLPSVGEGLFKPARRYASGEAPYDVEVCDVDGDGDLDPLVTSRDSLEVAVHFNPGNGDFSPPPDVPIPFGTSRFDHGDIDGDGDLDLVAGAGFQLEVLENPGNGEFLPPSSVALPGPVEDLALRDLDQDGDLDVIWNESDPPYRWGSALNDGHGTFTSATMWPVPTCGYFGAELGAFDFDRDGDLDVVVIENLGCTNVPLSARRLFVNENVDGRHFQLHGILVVNPNPRSLAAGDFDHDGNLDLVLTGQPTTVLLGNGDLTFVQSSAAMVPGINVATADFDHDGNLDFAIALQRNVAPFIESMVVQVGHGDGTFAPPATYLGSHSPDLAQLQEILCGDVDHDGDADVIGLNYASNDASLWLGRGDGTFAAQVRYGTGIGPGDMSWADFTGDGLEDLVVTTGSFPPLSAALRLLAGRDPFQPKTKHTSKTPIVLPRH